MDEPMIELARKMIREWEKFLIACKEAGDVTINESREEILTGRNLCWCIFGLPFLD